MCKGRMSCGETAAKGVGSECAFPHALYVPAASSQAKEESFNPGDKTWP